MKECPACHRCFPDKVNHCPSDGDKLKFLINLDTTLDERYLLEKKLGQGGMGLVFKAHHKFIKTQHAIKVIIPDLVGNDPSLTARFRQEAMAAAAIRHPNTVSVTDYGIAGGTMPYLVMEFVEGRSLHDILIQRKRLSPEEATEIMLAVCAGVAAAHRQGIVHRDLKPLNIMLRPGEPPAECLKVLDFGLAKIKSGELLGSFVAAQTQGMMGSPFYMAPEQWGDDDIDVRADIYSLGVILYQMLAGDVPFKGKSVPSIMSAHLKAQLTPLSERGVEVPEALEGAVKHALEKEPARRPASVEEFMAELRAAMPNLNGDAPVREVGVSTIQIGVTDTAGLRSQKGAQTGAHGEFPESQKTVAGIEVTSSTGPLEAKPSSAEPSSPASSTFANPSTVADSSLAGSSTAADASDTDGGRGTATASQQPAHTAGHFGSVEPASTQNYSAEALTEPLPASFDALRAEEERLRDESLRRAREEEARREAEERRLRDAKELQQREAEERRRREAEELQRREAEERAAALAAQQQQQQYPQQAVSAGSEQAAQSQQVALESQAAFQQGPQVSATPGVVKQTRSRAPFVVLGIVVLLALLACVGIVGFVLIQRSGWLNSNVNANKAANVNANTNANTNAGTNSNGSVNANQAIEQTHPDLVFLPGGNFKMGRSDVPPMTDDLKATRPNYLLWMYNQWPAHDATVKSFSIDRTEVTNAEYAQFVKETGHASPPGVWDGDRPKTGEERLPVTNVSAEDAREFAVWRSRRDGVTYRLPTEEEWEYAARGGDAAREFPWGSTWEEGRANLGTTGLRPVGSFPQGRTPQGVDDMIGNAWEWTSGEASMYKGNGKTKLAATDRGMLVIRGGSFESRTDGDKPISVSARTWVAPNTRDAHLGFRLVRVEQ